MEPARGAGGSAGAACEASRRRETGASRTGRHGRLPRPRRGQRRVRRGRRRVGVLGGREAARARERVTDQAESCFAAPGGTHAARTARRPARTTPAAGAGRWIGGRSGAWRDPAGRQSHRSHGRARASKSGRTRKGQPPASATPRGMAPIQRRGCSGGGARTELGTAVSFSWPATAPPSPAAGVGDCMAHTTLTPLRTFWEPVEWRRRSAAEQLTPLTDTPLSVDSVTSKSVRAGTMGSCIPMSPRRQYYRALKNERGGKNSCTCFMQRSSLATRAASRCAALQLEALSDLFKRVSSSCFCTVTPPSRARVCSRLCAGRHVRGSMRGPWMCVLQACRATTLRSAQAYSIFAPFHLPRPRPQSTAVDLFFTSCYA